MFLLINLSENNKIKLALFNESIYYRKTYSGQNRDLLICIDKFLKLKKLILKKLRGLIVVVGYGGFTSTRLSVVVGNTLAYTLNIPIIATNNPELSKEDLLKLIPQIKKQPIGRLISATYSGEANIGKSKNNN